MRCARMWVLSKLGVIGCASLIERWRLVSAFQSRQSPAPENRFLPRKAETGSTVSETSSHARARWTVHWWSSVSEPEHLGSAGSGGDGSGCQVLVHGHGLLLGYKQRGPQTWPFGASLRMDCAGMRVQTR